MRTGYIPGLAAIAMGVSIIGASAAPMDFILSAPATRTASTAAALQPPPGFQLNEKGFAGLRSAGAPGAASNPEHSNISRSDTVNNLLSPPDSLKNQLSNDQMLSPDKLKSDATSNLLSHPPK
jgi:hypothetical protein